MAKQFASAGDMAEKKITFSEIGDGLFLDPPEGLIGIALVEHRGTLAALDTQRPEEFLRGWLIGRQLVAHRTTLAQQHLSRRTGNVGSSTRSSSRARRESLR